MALRTSKEIMISQAWEQEAQKYTVDVKQLNVIQRYILESAKEYYEVLKKNEVSISKDFPHEIDSYEMALAWVVKVGNNPNLLRRMFKAVLCGGQQKSIEIEHIIYDPEASIFQGFVPAYDLIDPKKREIKNTNWFEPVLVLLYYSLICERDFQDRIKVVDSKEATKRRKGYIDITTEYFIMTIRYKDKEYEAFDRITITPTSQLKYRNNR